MADYFWKAECDKLKCDISTQATEITRLRAELNTRDEQIKMLKATIADVRTSALEEAAKIADGAYPSSIATAIRVLKTKT